MAERTHPQHEHTGPDPTGLDNPFDSTDGLAGIVSVRRGLHVENLPVGGLTVREIRRRFADRFDINAENLAFINGEPIDDESTVVRAGQRLDFTRNAGEKGCISTM